MVARSRGPLVFGIAVPAVSRTAAPQAQKFVDELGRHAKLDIVLASPRSYDALTAMVDQHKVDIAWLPPIPFIGLDGAKLTVPLVSHHRGGASGFHAVLIAHRDAGIMTLAQLKGKRVAWVDPLSASGYVLPRIQLAVRGLDPRILFKSERFYLSHEASVRAVFDRQADVAGTYARLDSDGSILRGSWSQVERAEGVITVVATFGAVPPDVTAARIDVDPSLRDRVTRALIAMSFDEIGAPLVRDVFGVDEFRPWEPADYEALRVAMAEAAARGLLDAGDATGQFPTQH